jgi:basic membrane protein A and related proteins
MPKWLRNFALPVVALGLIAAACSNSNDTSSSAAAGGSGSSSAPSCPQDFKVALALDVGGIGDQSFNDAANRGLQQAIADGLVCESNTKLVPANASGSNLDDNTQALAAAGYNYVEGVGFSFSPGIAKIASQYPNVNFGVIDGYATTLPGGKNAPNVADLTFKEEQGSYLVGIAAAMQAQADGSKTVGFLGGQTGPLIGKFQAGYEAGVASVDPSIKVLVEYIGDNTQAFVNPTAGNTLSTKMYNEGADIVYHAAGLSGAGLFQAAAAQQKWAIGVDSDQYLTASADQKKWILTSMLKRVDTATYNAIKQSGEGNFTSGFQVFGLAEDGVDFSTSNDALKPDMVDAMETAKQKIINGDITVPDTPKGS